MGTQPYNPGRVCMQYTALMRECVQQVVVVIII